MKCPVCDVTLSISAREGVEIDFCPQCRGVWLDRGELDKILDRVAVTAPATAPSFDDRDRRPERRDDDRPRYDDDRPRSEDRPRYDDPRYRDQPHRHDDRPRYDDRDRTKRKKRSFLEDILDFD